MQHLKNIYLVLLTNWRTDKTENELATGSMLNTMQEDIRMMSRSRSRSKGRSLYLEAGFLRT